MAITKVKTNKKASKIFLDEVNELRKEVGDAQKDAQSLPQKTPVSDLITKNESEARNKIANQFVYGYFGILLIIFIGIPLYNLIAPERSLLSLAEILQGYSAVIGPLIGFVVAYYFKTNK